MQVILENSLVGCDIQMKIHAPDDDIGVSNFIAEHKVWEPYETKLLLELIKDKAFFLDIGANIGYYSLIASKHLASDGIVISVEPEENNFSLLEQNIKLNHAENIRAFNIACTDKVGYATVKKSEDNFGDHRVVASDEKPTTSSVTTTTVDELIKEINLIPDLIKIDTQGAELSILKGMTQLLNNLNEKMLLIVEFWPFGIKEQGQSPQALIEFLREYPLNVLALFEETGRILPCDLTDLERWSHTILEPGSKQYVNLVIGHKDNKELTSFTKRHSDSCDRFKTNRPISAVLNNKLDSSLVPVGWSFPEEQGVWSSGRYSEIILNDIKIDSVKNHYVYLKLFPFLIKNNLVSQTVAIVINGVPAGKYKLVKSELTDLYIEIPDEIDLALTSKLRVGLEFLDTASPLSYGLSEDARLLAVQLNSFAIYDGSKFLNKIRINR